MNTNRNMTPSPPPILERPHQDNRRERRASDRHNSFFDVKQEAAPVGGGRSASSHHVPTLYSISRPAFSSVFAFFASFRINDLDLGLNTGLHRFPKIASRLAKRTRVEVSGSPREVGLKRMTMLTLDALGLFIWALISHLYWR